MSLKDNLSIKVNLSLLVVAMLMAACETDSYEKGEGKYSLMQADFADMAVNSQKEATAFTTDEGDSYQLTTPFTSKWIETPDTVYRTIIYYNKVRVGEATPVTASPVPTLRPVKASSFKEQPQDPIGLESAWIAATGKYLNIGLLMKTARIDDEEPPHNVALAQDTVYLYPDGRRTACYRFLHSQNNIPEYYTNRRYVSILLPEEPLDTVRFTIQTYNGLVEKCFPLTN